MPLRALVACCAVMIAAGVPAAVTISAALIQGSHGVGSATSAAANIAAACVAAITVLAFERPRSWSPLAYARQLRARFLELQSTYDAEFRRRPEGKEKEHDLEVPPEQ